MSGSPRAGTPARRGFGVTGAGDRGRSEAAPELAQLCSFLVGGEGYAVDIMRIKEIINPQPIRRVPGAPAFVEGVIVLRGAIFPVVDLRRRFGLPPAARTRASKVLIAALEGLTGARWIVGLSVDQVLDVIRIPPEEIRRPPAVAPGNEEHCFAGVCHHGGRIVMVIDLDALLSAGERTVLVAASDGPQPAIATAGAALTGPAAPAPFAVLPSRPGGDGGGHRGGGGGPA